MGTQEERHYKIECSNGGKELKRKANGNGGKKKKEGIKKKKKKEKGKRDFRGKKSS